MKWAALLMLPPIACAAQAQALSDPMRPPQAPVARKSEAPAAPGATAAEGSAGASQLQAILISGGRKLAVIDGVTVALGGRVGDATVVRITETEVRLRRGEQVERLKLHPAVEKTPVRKKPDAQELPQRKPAGAGKEAR
jgi:MSHA biogenesis protein MshK